MKITDLKKSPINWGDIIQWRGLPYSFIHESVGRVRETIIAAHPDFLQLEIYIKEQVNEQIMEEIKDGE